MAQIIGLPKLSPTMEEGVLVKWVKGEGDSVSPGDLVAEVETDKANMDFNIEDEGVLLKLLVKEGDTVKLGAPVAIMGDKGEDISALIKQAEALMSGGGAAAASSAGKAGTADQPGGPGPLAQDRPLTADVEEKRAPAQAQPAAVAAASAAASAASQPGAATSTAAPAQPAQDTGGRVLASPLAKNLAIELGIDLKTVQGTGPGGRIVERDVQKAAESRKTAATAPAQAATPRAAPAQAAAPAAAEAPRAPAAQAARPGQPGAAPALPDSDADFRDEPLTSMRKRIAQRLTEAKRDIPHIYLTRSFDAGPLVDFRKRLNDLLGDRGKLSVNDLIIKGVALALRRVPECNAAFLGEAIRYFNRVHVGVAVAIDNGLVTPVVRDADLKGVSVIANEIRDLATRARSRQLKVHEIQGSTFTVSNLGMFGIEEFQAIVNPPEAAILAVGTTLEQPVVVDGRLKVGKRMNLTMSCDHRVVDGALGARYLKELVDILEHPESLAL